uniref:Dolichol-phosphate mannosyltransferase subunit 3 n=1 Tax=Prolemur simus TaxID=1328070 RepID=A0A8C9DDF3_PROSS
MVTVALGIGTPGLHLGSSGHESPGRELRLSRQRSLPAYLLESSGCYALGALGCPVVTFHNCEDAALKLQNPIQDALRDLARRGLHF